MSQIFQVAPTKLAVAAVTGVQAPQAIDAAGSGSHDPRDSGQSQGRQLSEQRVRETMDKMKSLQSSGDLKAIAKAIGGEVKTTQFFTSDGAADGIGPASIWPRRSASRPARRWLPSISAIRSSCAKVVGQAGRRRERSECRARTTCALAQTKKIAGAQGPL